MAQDQAAVNDVPAVPGRKRICLLIVAEFLDRLEGTILADHKRSTPPMTQDDRVLGL